MNDQPPPYNYQSSAPSYENHSTPLVNARYIIKQRNSDIRHFPINASFFLLGFLFPPIWLLSWLCWPKSENRYEVFWRKLNTGMSIVTIIAILIFTVMIGIAVWEDTEYNNHPRRDIPQWILSLFLSFFIS